MENKVAFTVDELKEINFTMENFMLRRAPAEEFKKLIDHTYTIKYSDIIIKTLRSSITNNEIINETIIAKIKFIKTSEEWKIYWVRYNEKWDEFKMDFKIKRLSTCLKIIDDDEQGCFWG